MSCSTRTIDIPSSARTFSIVSAKPFTPADARSVTFDRELRGMTAPTYGDG